MLADLKLPTDNLYKFICIFGLAIFLAGYLLYWAHYKPFIDSSIRSEMLLRESASQWASLTTSMKSLDGSIKTAMDDKNWEKLKAALGAFRMPRFHDPNLLEESFREFLFAVKSLYLYRQIAYSGMAAGVIIALVGAYFWYTRVQKYEDQILMESVKRATP